MLKNRKKVKVSNTVTLSGISHNYLVGLLSSKIENNYKIHDEKTDRYEVIDKELAGYLVLDEDDAKRDIENKKGYGVKTIDSVMNLTFAQIDEATTYLLEVLSSDSGLYAAIATKDKQPVATAFSALMNEHADKFKHERHLAKFLFDSLKYNFAACSIHWKKVSGTALQNNESMSDIPVTIDEIYAGNSLRSIDLYNFHYDRLVDPVELAEKGEYFAEIECMTEFQLKRLKATNLLFNLDDLLEEKTYSIKYYKDKPTLRTENSSSNKKESWSTFFGLQDRSGVPSSGFCELAKFHIWIDLKDIGISPKSDLKICRVILANNSYIVDFEVLNNAHGLLPVAVTVPIDDGFEDETKSFAEMLLPFQQFSSAQLNVHKKAAKKALYGITFFNKNVLDLDDTYDPIASKVAVNAPKDVDIRRSIHTIYDAPNTSNTLRDIEAVNTLMQKILPTDILKQVSSLERATQYQAAATVQGANRRNLKIARIINSQAFSQLKQMQMYNILQYQKTAELLSPEGDLVEINPSEFRDTKLEFTVSDGLKGLDRMSMVMSIKEVLNTIVQSQQASQQIDVVAVINYWTSLIGDKTDFSQFKFQSEIDKLPPEQKDMAFQLLQQFMQQQEEGGAQQDSGEGGDVPQ